MARRLTEEDIRRIFREEADAQRKYDLQMAEVTEEAREVRRRLTGLEPAYRPGANIAECDWDYLVQQVIDTYWEVVEEDFND